MARDEEGAEERSVQESFQPCLQALGPQHRPAQQPGAGPGDSVSLSVSWKPSSQNSRLICPRLPGSQFCRAQPFGRDMYMSIYKDGLLTVALCHRRLCSPIHQPSPPLGPAITAKQEQNHRPAQNQSPLFPVGKSTQHSHLGLLTLFPNCVCVCDHS